MSSGVLYIASGESYVKEALYSASTLRAQCDVPITLFSDRPVNGDHFDEVRVFAATHKRPKVELMSETPYERTLYLDSDTQVNADISTIFSLLDKFDIAAAHDDGRVNPRIAKTISEYGSIDYSFPEFNSGVVLYKKNEKISRFFELWKEYYHKFSSETEFRDQPTFRIALWRSEVLLHTLPFEYNVRCQAIRDKMRKPSPTRDALTLAPRIHHWHGVGQVGWLKRFQARYRPIKY